MMKRGILLFLLLLNAIPMLAQSKDAMLQGMSDAMQQGEIAKARGLCETLLGQYDKTMSFSERGTVLLTLSSCYGLLGHEDLARQTLQSAETLASDASFGMDVASAQWFVMLALSYLQVDYNKGLAFLLKGIDIYEELEVEDETYAVALQMLAKAYEDMVDDRTALVKRMLPKIFAVAERVAGKQSITYSNAFAIALQNAIDRRAHAEAIGYLDQCIALGADIFDAKSRYRFAYYGKRAVEHAIVGNTEKALADARKYSSDLKNYFFANYKNYDTKEISSNFGYIQSWFCDDILRVAEVANSPEINRMAYDGLLFAKGLFLNTELSALKSSGIESLRNDSWKGVQASLKPGEAAIEFISYVTRNLVTNYFHNFALVIRPGQEAPQLVPLGEVNGVDDQIRKTSLTDKCRRYWLPLQQALRGVSTIYFSPHAEMHQLPVEHFIPEEMNIGRAYRLSSTRELLKPMESRAITSPVVFGGLVYEMTSDEWAMSGAALSTINGEMFAMRSAPDLRALRAQRAGNVLDYLPGTKHEADIIVGLLRSKKLSPLYLNGIHGTEDAFKMLSGKGVSLLHIGTHGYYFSANDDFFLGDDIDNILNNGQSTVLREQASLSLSGLFLSGAEDALSGQGQPEGYEDGVLTALDIARMDFSDLDLVVLSACQTGLGNVTYEGVSGLQRGFKIAGARSIIMSMWDVSDAATSLLMRRFYSDFVEGKSKIEAFSNAVAAVRKAFPDPQDWAPFVLLDGVR